MAGISVAGLAEWRARLEAVQAEAVMAAALAREAEAMAAAVQAGLGEAAGEGAHDKPWLRSGALRGSVGSVADGLTAVVGSSDPAAMPQELGTRVVPPRPFLAPVAAERGGDVAERVGAAVAAAIRGEEAGAEGVED